VIHAPKSGNTSVLLVTDGLEEGLTGTLVYCVKTDATKDIKMRIIADVCYFSRFNHISPKIMININFLRAILIHDQKMVMRINKMITYMKMICFSNNFLQLIFKRICMESTLENFCVDFRA